jgi:hypothetical protein
MTQAWVTTPANNAGLALIFSVGGGWDNLATQEHATAAWRPYLTVTWTVPTPPTPPTGRSVHDITKDFARLMFTPLMQTGKAWMVCNVMGSGRQVWTDAWDAMDDTARPGDTAADLAMRQWLRKVFLSTIGISVQGASAPVLPYMGGGGTRMILRKEILGEAVRYAQMP